MRPIIMLLLAAPFLFLFPKFIAAQAPDLGAASSFALFTASGAFNGDAATSINGDIGTDAGAFSPPGFLVGQIHNADPISAQAAADAGMAYGFLAGLTCGSVLTTPLGNSQTLGPNIYCIGTAAVLNANLTLDGGGDPGALFIFQIDGALSTNILSSITLINGANLCNVYWQINGALNVGGNTFFQGTVLAQGAINLGNGATLLGRGLSTAGAISTSANNVALPNGCLCELDVICPAPPTGIYSCISGIPAGAAADVTVLSACGTSSVAITESSTGSGCLGNPYILTRTYTVTDDGGNASACVVTYTAIDQNAPSITCPAAISVSCASNVPAAAPATVVATDFCGGVVTVASLGDVIAPGACANRFSITRTYRATDLCGNSATCAQLITVNDIIPPSLTCLPAATVSCAGNVPAPAPGALSASDLCGGNVNVALVGDVLSNQTCPNRYTITRTYRATDLCGNTATCAQLITVNDVAAPSLTCLPAVNVSCAGNVPAPAPGALSASDLCGGTVSTILVGDVLSNQTCPNRFTITRTYRATDLCGNSATCAQLITVNDITIPSITCPPNVAVTCSAQVPASAPASVTASDLCGGTASVILLSDVITNQTCANRYTLTRSYQASDVCGNTAVCAQVISVLDNIAPVFLNPPQNSTVECNAVPPVGTPPGASDQCTGAVSVVLASEIQTAGICPVIYTLTRTWRATDLCGNTATVSQVITVQDTYAPQFSVFPEDVVLDCDLASNELVFQEWIDGFGNAVVSDCSVITHSVLPSPFFIAPSTCGGTSQQFMRFTATDQCGNSAYRDARFTVVDLSPPVFDVLPQDLIVECIEGDQGEGVLPDWIDNFGYASVSDKCGTVSKQVVLQSNTPGCGNTFTRIYQFRATDECGNTKVVTATFAVVDHTPPVIITCPAGNVLLTCEFDIPAPDTSAFIVYDACGLVTKNLDNIFSVGVGCVYWPLTKSYTYTATDACGNVSTCFQSFQVVDSIPPIYSGPDTIAVLCVDDLPGIGEIAGILAPYFSDNCYDIICVNEGMTVSGANWVTYCIKAKDLCVNWTEKFFVTFIVTGGCKPLCSAPQSVWGNPGAQIKGMDVSEVINQLTGKYSALIAGKLGKTISVSSAACLQSMLPSAGNTVQFSPGNHIFSTDNQCDPASPALQSDGSLKNKLAANALAMQLNIWFNREFNERDLGVQHLLPLPACLVETVVLQKLESDHINVQGLLNLSNDYLAGVGFFPPNFGAALNAALENLSNYWKDCQLNNPCSGTATVAGYLKTPSNDGLEKANVTFKAFDHAGPMPDVRLQTDAEGYYAFPDAVPMLGKYTLVPDAEGMDQLNGVTTYDLTLISKHILGQEPLNSPYKMIAADANRSGSITTLDMIELRKLILGIYETLPDNTAWRFVDKSFVFPDVYNPFATAFPEFKTSESVQSSHMDEDFTGVKTGDVNGTAKANLNMKSEDRSKGVLLFKLEDRMLKAGEVFEQLLTADQLVQGFQFTLNTIGLEIMEVQGSNMGPGNYAVFAPEEAITVSWNLQEGSSNSHAQFSLRMRATRPGRLSDMLSLSNRITKVEAYTGGNKGTRLDIALKFQDAKGPHINGPGFELYQNVPNPFVDKTNIGFYLPGATEVTLTIYDATGRQILVRKAEFEQGNNSFLLDRELIQSGGALRYKVETSTDRATRTMIQGE